jgi:hypothetical protein
MPPVITFLPNGGKPEEIDVTQIFEDGVGRRQARDEEAQGRHVEERPLRQEGQEPQAGDCDRAVGGEGQGQEGAEEGGEEAQGFEEAGGEEVEAEGDAITFVIASEAKQSIDPLCRAMDCFASLAMTAREMTRLFPSPLVGEGGIGGRRT